MKSKANSDVHLEKNLSPLNVLSLAVGCMIGWGAFVLPAESFLPKAGPLGAVIAVSIAVIIMSIISHNYSFMINLFPVTGGAFAYTREAFGTHHSFICSWFLSLSYLSIVPLNGTALALIGRVLFPKALQFGFHYTVAGYHIYFGEILLAASVIIIFGFLSIMGVKFAGQFENYLVTALVIGIGVLLTTCIFSSKADFSNLKPVFSPDVNPVAGILSIVAVAPWALAGFETIPQAVEEFKFSVKKTQRLMILSIVSGGAVYAVLNIITAMTVPQGYDNWFYYIKAVPNLEGLESLPTFNASQMLLGKIGLAFLGVAILSAILSSIIGFYMATSRLLYSMAGSSLLPKWFAKVHPKYKTPANAIIFTMLVSLFALPFGRTALNWIVSLSSVGASVGYLYTSLASLKYSLKQKRIGIIVTSVIGSLSGLAFLIILLIPLPNSPAALGVPSYICLLIWIILGAVFHVSKCRKMKKENEQK